MNAPTYVCLQKKNIAPVTFTQWLAEDSHVYIGSNLSKYAHDLEAEDEWGHLDLDRQLLRRDIGYNEFYKMYEDYIRREKWDKLDELTDKVLGCWCSNPERCHFSVIIKLFHEKQTMKKKKKNGI